MVRTIKMTLFLLIVVLCQIALAEKLKLKQVVILSRHNVRTPLRSNLQKVTPNAWPEWNAKIGHLTPKGTLLEGLMGEYFAAWLKSKDILTEECPDHAIHIYANSIQRTRESAKAFAERAFKKCNIDVFYKYEDDKMDYTFHPVIHNDTDVFKDKVVEIMKRGIKEAHLTPSYKLLNEIVDFKNSDMCKEDSICDLAEEESRVYYEVNEEPNVRGPLAIGNAVVDTFMMEYYNEMPLEDVAWGKIINSDQWKLLMEINEHNHNVRFNNTVIAKDVAKPLIEYMKTIFQNESLKFAMLVGHDSNIYSLMAAMDFKHYNLPEQYEKVPVGSKIVFQKWHDEGAEKDLLKVNYVYQTTQQIRNGAKLSLDNPPYWIPLEMNHCNVDVHGYCLWEDFINMLQSI